jgi:hypothetical protein
MRSGAAANLPELSTCCATRISSLGSGPTTSSSGCTVSLQIASREVSALSYRSSFAERRIRPLQNIVEGLARRSRAQQIHLLNIPEGSLAETAYCLHLARRLEYISEPEFLELDDAVRQVFAPLAGLIRHTRETV